MTATKKPARTLSYSRLTGILHLADRKGETGYYVDALAHDLGATFRCFRLTKILTTPGRPDHYDAVVSADHVGSGCECMGHLRHGHCKHVESLRCLIQRGSI